MQSPMDQYKIGIDLGGTKTEILLLTPKNEEVFRKRVATPRDTTNEYESIKHTIAFLVNETRLLIPDKSGYTIGIGIPGSFDHKTGLVQNANTQCLMGKPFKKDIELLLMKKVAMENDANCFTLAESIAGSGQGYDLVFGIIMGTGCGGGICINKSIRRGPNGIAGEWGHFSIDPLGDECYCGNRGCVETIISGTGLESSFFRKYKRKATVLDIVNGYRKGEPQCKEAFETFLQGFGRSVGGLVSVLDPDAIVIGGGLSNIEELYSIGARLVKHYAFHKDVNTPVLKNLLGDSAGVFGAAWVGSRSI